MGDVLPILIEELDASGNLVRLGVIVAAQYITVEEDEKLVYKRLVSVCWEDQREGIYDTFIPGPQHRWLSILGFTDQAGAPLEDEYFEVEGDDHGADENQELDS
jgi:hypothetical protein